MNTHRRNRRERGQILILCALSLLVLLLVLGLSIDFGFAYVTRASLGKAVDASALTAARYMAKGQSQAEALARRSFAVNYGTSGRDATTPNVSVSFGTDAKGNSLVSVSATVTVRTFFIGLLPSFRTLSVANSAQATASRVLMTLVLDRTGSMDDNGGAAKLPGAVESFIEYFDDSKDTVAEVSFANDVSVDVGMTTGNFQKKIIASAKSISANPKGPTWSDGALQQALTLENSVTVNETVRKVVLFFTDGNANTIQQSLTCTHGASLKSGKWNVGGFDDGATVGFLKPNVKTDATDCRGNSGKNCCAQNFTSLQYGSQTINWTNVSGPTGDARYRAIADSDSMRTQDITVYAIGLGSDVDESFLCRIANDPCSSAYDSSQPAGVMQWVQTADELDPAFQKIATIIRLRLTQ